MKTQTVIAAYHNLPFFTFVFIALRWLSCPFEEIVRFLPKQGNILDIGCGYGLLELVLTQKNPKQKIIGIDPDKQRVRVVKKVFKSWPQVDFFPIQVAEIKKRKFSTIVILDVLYLLPPWEKKRVLDSSYKLLRAKGTLLIKFNDKSRSFGFLLTWLQEFINVRMLRKTSSKYAGFYFENTAELSRLLNEAGFKVKKLVKLSTPFPFFHPHNLIIARKI